MKKSARQTTLPAGLRVPDLWVSAASLLLPVAALAQANACDQLKATLAARIEATGVRGYSLEVVPASTPAPAGAKAIGNCEGGARKVLYRRWGGGAASADAAIAVAPASPAATAVAGLGASPKRPPAERPMAAVPAPVASAAVPPPALALSPAAPPPPVVASAAEAPVTPAEPLAAKAPLPQRAVEFVTTNRNWLLALLLVPLAALGWAWRAHHLAYDKNGLPRGPRL